jgi:SAM-dependent methyltransferase
MIAYALEVDPILLPLVPELLADLDELGCDADLIVEVLEDLGLPGTSRVLDLGCGKGAVAIEIARELGFRVLGIDLFEPFIAHCRERAASAGVSNLCKFQHADILKVVDAFDPVDVAVFAAMGDVLGPLEETMGVIRRFVRPGGYIVINDDYVKDGGKAAFPRFESYASHDQTLRQLQSHGDLLVREALEALDGPDSGTSEGTSEGAVIRRRAEELAEQHPDLKAALLAFADEQIREYAFMEANLVPAVWLLRRSG